MTKQGTSTVLTQTLGYRDISTTATTAQVATLTNTASGYGKTYTYTYDDNGNILSVSDGTYTTSYVYDTANQLVRENNQELNKTWTWTYDAAGNILSRKEYAYTTGTLGTPTDTVSYGYATSGWKDLLTSYDGFSYSYDTIGNPVYDGIWTYTWEHGRELESQYRIITFADGKQKDIDISYVYDVNGMRTQKAILSRWFAGTTSAPVEYMVDEQYDYVYNGSSLSQLKVTTETTVGSGSPTTATESLNFTYDASGTPMTVTHNGTTYYYVTNLQGDVTDILNASGTAVVSYTYDAWGNIRSTTGTLSATLGKYNPLRYRGYVYDTDTKFYYLQSRYYNPETGRFINADALVSTGQSFEGNNMFAYCGNNPVRHSDSEGNKYREELPQFNYCEYTDEYGGLRPNFVSTYRCFWTHMSAQAVLDAGFLAMYEGKLVVKIPGGNAFSFGIMFIGNEVNDINTVKHEYGHTVQYDQMGFFGYLTFVAIPSLTGYWSGVKYDEYFSQLYEFDADVKGKVKRDGYQYFKNGIPEPGLSAFFMIGQAIFE